MCGNFPNIKVVEGNAFSVLIPLKVRTFESCKPIDEDIDPLRLTNVVFKFGGVEYTPVVDARGVSAVLPATLARGSYDIVLTADYGDNAIRAAYESAVSIVAWNSQSDAQQYLPGSPIVLDAAYIIGGALTDAELEELKQQLREDIAEAEQAKEDAEAAKEEWERRIEELDDVAKESTSQEIKTQAANAASDAASVKTLVGTPASGQPSDLFAAIAGINIDTSTIAKQGTNQNATLSEVQAEIGATQTAVAALPTLQQIKDAGLVPLNYGGVEFLTGHEATDVSNLLFGGKYVTRITDDDCEVLTVTTDIASTFTNLVEYAGNNVSQFGNPGDGSTKWCQLFRGCYLLEIVRLPRMRVASQSGSEAYFMSCPKLRLVDFTSMPTLPPWYTFTSCPNLIDLIIGGAFTGNVNFSNNGWNPTNALDSSLSTLVTDTEDEFGNPITNNLEQLLYNIRRHLAANLRTDVGNCTITFSSAMKAAILADTPTMNAFPANWTIA